MTALLHDPSAASRLAQAEHCRRLKQWLEEMGTLGEAGVAHVAEIECQEPGCPDLATVVTLLYPQPTEHRTIKFYKPMQAVTRNELIHAVLQSFADGPPAIAELKAALRSGHHAHPAVR